MASTIPSLSGNGGSRNLREDVSAGRPAFVARLRIEYKDGGSEELLSDSSWHHARGPVVKNDVYLGTVFDARRKVEGWDLPRL